MWRLLRHHVSSPPCVPKEMCGCPLLWWGALTSSRHWEEALIPHHCNSLGFSLYTFRPFLLSSLCSPLLLIAMYVMYFNSYLSPLFPSFLPSLPPSSHLPSFPHQILMVISTVLERNPEITLSGVLNLDEVSTDHTPGHTPWSVFQLIHCHSSCSS